MLGGFSMLGLHFTKRAIKAKRFGEISPWLVDARNRVFSQGGGGQPGVGEPDMLVVDISSVEVVNSREIGEIARMQLALREQGKRLILENAQQQVCDVFDMTRMNRLVDVRPSLEFVAPKAQTVPK
jgi:hypothetical protein